MKIILVLCLTLTTTALPIPHSSTEIPLEGFQASMSILERWTRLMAKKLEIEVSNQIDNEEISIARPFASFHPTTIGSKGKELRQDWQDFEFKGFGPSVNRRFGSMDFRIIGKK